MLEFNHPLLQCSSDTELPDFTIQLIFVRSQKYETCTQQVRFGVELVRQQIILSRYKRTSCPSCALPLQIQR